MDKDLQNDKNIVSFDFGAFDKIDYSMEDPDNWSFEEEKEIGSSNEGCEKIKIIDINSNKI